MHPLRERTISGLAALEAVTALLQRNRSAHPTAGLWEAADFQWWWRVPRATDDVPQLVWVDDDDRPAAAVIATAWPDRVALDPIVLPDAEPGASAQVMARGLAHVDALGLAPLGFEVDPADGPLMELLAAAGFAVQGEAIVESWLDLVDRPAIGALAGGYRLTSRHDDADRHPHHMTSEARRIPDPEARLRQTSLYRDDLDLVVLDDAGEVAAYGLFWHDPVSRTGLVEPMRTEDAHQRRGLARHVLTAGLDLLAAAGAERVKICFEPDNPASSRLYRSVGFRPVRTTVTVARG